MRKLGMLLGATALLLTPAAAAQTTDAGALGALLPDAPSGWSSTDGAPVQSQVAGTTVAQVSRTYTDGTGVEVELVIVGSPSMVAATQGAAMMFGNPAMVNQMNANNPDKQFAVMQTDGWTGWTVIDTPEDSSELTGFNDELVVTLKLNRADADVLNQFRDLVPWAELGALNE